MEKGNPPLVSVLVPAYNHGEYIERCIESIWQQTYPNIEIIVINDGSSDNTGELLDKLKSQSKHQMQVIHQKNAGLCRTLNRLNSLSNGKYIISIASDDELYPERINNHVSYLEKNDDVGIAGCFGQQQVIDENSCIKIERVVREINFDNQHIGLLEGKIPFSLQGTTFIASIYSKFEFDENLAFEDWDFYLRLTMEYRLAYIPSIAFRYRGHEEGLNRNVSKMASARIAIFQKLKDYDSVVKYGKRKFLANIYILNAKGYFYCHDLSNARASALSAISSDFGVVIRELDFVYKPFLGRYMLQLLRYIKGR